MSGLRLFNLGGSEIRTEGNVDTMGEMNSMGVSLIEGIGNNSITISSGTSILFDTNNNERMRIMPGGNIGIGTSNPNCIIDIANPEGKINLKSTNDVNFSNINLESAGGDKWHISGPRGTTEGNLGFYYVDGGSFSGELLSLKKDGNVGIGTDNPQYRLDLNNGTMRTGSASFFNDSYKLDTSSNRLNFRSGQQFAFFAQSNSTPVIGIYQQYVSINTELYNQSNYVFYSNGLAGGTQNWNTSDDRIKYNEVILDGVSSLALINQLNPQYYEKIIETPPGVSGNWIPTDDEWDSVKDNYKWNNEAGLIAQEIRAIPGLSFAVLGEEVNEEGTQTPLSLNYNDIYAYHIAATKELSSQLEAEKVKVANLISRIEALENA